MTFDKSFNFKFNLKLKLSAQALKLNLTINLDYFIREKLFKKTYSTKLKLYSNFELLNN